MGDFIQGAEVLVDERIAYANANGLSPRVGDTYRVPNAPWRKVWHTTEVVPPSLANCRSLAIRHRTPPQIWASYEHDWVGQTVPLSKSAYALLHNSGDPETNHMHAIQTEVFGYAANGLRGEICDWLGKRVLRPIIDQGYPIDLSLWTPSTGQNGSGYNGAVRLSWSWWANYSGQCNHANVPGNHHWDTGITDYERIARAAGIIIPPTPTPVPILEDEMEAIVYNPGNNTFWWLLVDGPTTKLAQVTGDTATKLAGKDGVRTWTHLDAWSVNSMFTEVQEEITVKVEMQNGTTDQLVALQLAGWDDSVAA